MFASIVSGPRVWIVGDCIIRRARDRASTTRLWQLGTQHDFQWHGQGGARVEDLGRFVDNEMRSGLHPTVVIPQSGIDNIGQSEAAKCREVYKKIL